MIIPNTYYDDHPGISQSMLKEFSKSPRHYFCKYIEKSIEQKESESMRIGTLVHAMLLQPDKQHMFPVFDGEKRTNEQKAKYAEMQNEACKNGGFVVRRDEYDVACAMVESVKSTSTWGIIESHLQLTEAPLEWTCEHTDLLCKGRIDGLVGKEDKQLVVEIKTTADASFEGFSKSIFNFGYDLQAAHYMQAVATHIGKSPDSFLFVLVENKAPYLTAFYELGAETIYSANAARIALMKRFKECRDKNEWPGYSEEIKEINIPFYAMTKREEVSL